jgi:hypothetical protein
VISGTCRNALMRSYHCSLLIFSNVRFVCLHSLALFFRECAFEAGLEFPIPNIKVLVEFISVPKNNPKLPRMMVVRKTDTVPYNTSLTTSDVKRRQGGAPIEWDHDNMMLLKKVHRACNMFSMTRLSSILLLPLFIEETMRQI